MNKKDFIDRLRAALNGNVAPGIVADNVNFYEEYIDGEIRKGLKEEEVLRMLGDPRLIAKTIIETNAGDGAAYQGSSYRDAEYQDNGYQNSDYRKTTGYGTGHDRGEHNGMKLYRMPGWLLAVISIVALVLIFGVVLSVLSFLAPVILTIVVVLFLVKLFRDWLN